MDLLEREEQLRRLGDALASAMKGRDRIVAISGEAGDLPAATGPAHRAQKGTDQSRLDAE